MPFKPLSEHPQLLHTNLLPQFLNSTQACQLLSCSHQTLIRYYRGYTRANGVYARPVLTVIHRCGRKLFAKADLLEFLVDSRVAA
jgi:hypothetical protein